MKRVFITILVLILLFLTGCTTPKNETATPDAENSSTSTINTTADKTEDNAVEEPHFQEDVPLFVCQDRSDIEGDRNTIYFYNCKRG